MLNPLYLGVACLAFPFFLPSGLSSCAMVSDLRVDKEGQARELGQVDWGRDHDQAFLAARRDGKPVLLLFQEIPG